MSHKSYPNCSMKCLCVPFSLNSVELPPSVRLKSSTKPLIKFFLSMVLVSGLQMAKSQNAQIVLKKIGLGKVDEYFWKQIGKALLCTCALLGVALLYNETSPLGWWTLKLRPDEERELAHLYERREFPYSGDKEAMEEFITKEGMTGTPIGPKGFVDLEKESYNYQKELQNKKFDQEAQKLWLRMRNEVVSELQGRGLRCCVKHLALSRCTEPNASYDEFGHFLVVGQANFTQKGACVEK